MTGDLDDDLFPDAAFVANNSADVVLNISSTPTKLSVGAGIVAADVGRAPGTQRYSLIVAKLLSGKFVWSAMDIVTLQDSIFAEIFPLGSPVVGCYVADTYTPAVFVKSKTRPALRIFTPSADTTVLLPAGTVSAVCSLPENGTSSVFGLINNPRNAAFSVVGRNGSQTVVSSPSLDPRLKEMKLGTVPRALGQTPAPTILARIGNRPVLRVLNRSNRWRSVALPRVPLGSAYTALSGIRNGIQSYVVLQVTSRAKETSYIKVPIPPELL